MQVTNSPIATLNIFYLEIVINVKLVMSSPIDMFMVSCSKHLTMECIDTQVTSSLVTMPIVLVVLDIHWITFVTFVLQPCLFP